MASSWRRMKTIGILFKSIQWRKSPFKDNKVRKAYEFLAKQGKNNNIDFIFSTFDSLKKDSVNKYWKYDCENVLNEKIKLDAIFDRAKTDKKNIRSKKAIKVKMINLPELNFICWNKAETYRLFSKFMPKTFLVNNMRDVKKVLPKIKTDKVVLKPIYGMKGTGICFNDKDDIKKVKKSMLIQELIDNSGGIKELKIKGVHDIRIVVINGKIHHSYVRVAKRNSFLTNCAKGGRKIFIDKKRIPKSAIKLIKQIDKEFKKFNPRIYSADITYNHNQEPILIELESNTGFIYYDQAPKIRKDFIENIIKVLSN